MRYEVLLEIAEIFLKLISHLPSTRSAKNCHFFEIPSQTGQVNLPLPSQRSHSKLFPHFEDIDTSDHSRAGASTTVPPTPLALQ